MIGNDVVDLADPRCRGKAEDVRFVARVFSEEEARRIRSAEAPDRVLWLLWAAKEAAFKSVSKLRGSPPVFEHPAFVVEPDAPPDPTSTTTTGAVRYQGARLPFLAEWSPDRIHAVTWYPRPGAPPPRIRRVARLLPDGNPEEDPGWKRGLRPRFTAEEWRSIHRPESALVRLQARADLARALGVREGALEIICPPGPAGRLPPEVRIGDEAFEADLSLSHHGRFLAWAYTLST